MAYSHAEANLLQRQMLAAYLAKRPSVQRGATVKRPTPPAETTATRDQRAVESGNADR